MYKDDNSKMKWRVTPNFSIDIDIKDIAILENIKDTFGVGKVEKIVAVLLYLESIIYKNYKLSLTIFTNNGC